MSIQIEKTQVEYLGDGVINTFIFTQSDFTIISLSTLKVRWEGIDGEVVILQKEIDYEINLTPISSDDSNYLYTGQVVLINFIPKSGEKIRLYRETPINQDVILNEHTRVSPKEIEKTFDRFTQILQEVKYQQSFQFKVEIDGQTFKVILPPAGQRGRKVLGFDGNDNFGFREESAVYISDLENLAVNTPMDSRKNFISKIFLDELPTFQIPTFREIVFS